MIKNFKTIAEKCIKGKISGVFVLGIGEEIHSNALDYNYDTHTMKLYPYRFVNQSHLVVTSNGKYRYRSHTPSLFDVVEFRKNDDK